MLTIKIGKSIKIGFKILNSLISASHPNLYSIYYSFITQIIQKYIKNEISDSNISLMCIQVLNVLLDSFNLNFTGKGLQEQIIIFA